MGIVATDFMNFDLSQFFQQTADYINDALSKGGTLLLFIQYVVQKHI